jgi:hypothetical protein
MAMVGRVVRRMRILRAVAPVERRTRARVHHRHGSSGACKHAAYGRV